MPKIEYSSRFAHNFAGITSSKVEARVRSALRNVEMFGEFGSADVPASVRREYGDSVRMVVVNPFDLIYRYFPDDDRVRVEALIYQRSVH